MGTDLLEKKTLQIGGNYTAVDNRDGTFDILDVPIFASLPANAKRNEKPIGSQWMEKAIEKNKARAKEGHLPPVHIQHHDVGVKPEYAGKFVLTRVGKIKHEGKEVDAIFADIVGMPQEVFERVQKGFLPYRSVEIFNWDDPEIDSLALMDTEVPFFRIEMLTIGEVVSRSTFSSQEEKSPAVFWKGEYPKLAILFRFQEKKMSDIKKFEDDEEKKDDVKMGDLPGGGSEPQKFQGEEILSQVLALLQAIAQKVGAMPQQAQDEPVEDGNKAPVQEMSADIKTVAKLEGKISALEEAQARREKQDRINALVAKAKKDLSGYALSAKTEERLYKFAEIGDAALQDFVASHKENTPQDPPASMAELETSLLKKSDIEEVSKFALAKHGGADVTEWARNQAQLHAEYVKATKSNISLSDWLETNYSSKIGG